MNTLGIRVTPAEALYVVYGDKAGGTDVLTTDKLKAPASYDIPDALSWYRENFLSVCEEQQISGAVIRVAESNQQSRGSGVIRRLYVEGVIAEGIRSKGILVRMGPLATIGSLLGEKNPKRFLDQHEFAEITVWSTMRKEMKEAALASVAAYRVAQE